MSRALDDWFVTEILPHEAALMRYITRAWKRAADVPDLCQDVYVRVYESAANQRPRAAKAFLFTTARNLMIDRMRRERVVSIDYSQDLASLDVSIDELSPERRLSARQEMQRLAEAFDDLPAMTRAVIWLRRVEGLSQREAARSLGIEEGALEGYMCRGMRGLAKAIFGGVPPTDVEQTADITEPGTKHGQRSD